jgi:arylsulfatase A-like enzyme
MQMRKRNSKSSAQPRGLRGFVGCALALALGIALAAAAPARARDNFLIVVGDDLGVDKVGVYSRDDLYGHPGEGANPPPTPTIDGLAAEGVLFRNAYANPACTPTRAAALTGRHGFRTGIGGVGGELPTGERILPELVAATHANAALGKWHLGPNGDADHPNDSGFDYYAGALGGGVGDYTSWQKTTQGVTVQGHPVYATSDSVDEAIAAIAGFGANPWFVWLAFNAPHTPFHAPPPALHTQTLSGDPDDTPIDHYAAAVEALDTELARLLASIPQDVLDDTTIIFFGDNGTPRQAVEAPFDPNRAKGSVYEGGVNVPLIVKGPHVPVANRGSESLALVGTVDLFATVADIVGVFSAAQDSLSLLPYLQDPALPTRAIRHYAYTEIFSPDGFGPYDDQRQALRDDQYKLIRRDGVDAELFDLIADPPESMNLLDAALTPDQQDALDRLSAWMDDIESGVLPSVPAFGPGGTALLALAMLASGRRRLRDQARCASLWVVEDAKAGASARVGRPRAGGSTNSARRGL